MNKPNNTFCNRTHRREFLRDLGGGFASLGLTGMLAGWVFSSKTRPSFPSSSIPLPPKPPLPAKAKSVIFCSCTGDPARRHDQTDLYPHGKTIKVKPWSRGKRNCAGSSGRSGTSNLTGNVARWSPTCSHAGSVSTTLLSPLHDGRVPIHAHDERRQFGTLRSVRGSTMAWEA